MSAPGSLATVEINLDGTIYLLQPKLSAMKAINRMAGGYAGAFRSLQSFDADAYVGVVVAGTGATGETAKAIERRVYTHGIESLLAPLTRFVQICTAGGRDPEAKEIGSPNQQDEGDPDTRDLNQAATTATRVDPPPKKWTGLSRSSFDLQRAEIAQG